LYSTNHMDVLRAFSFAALFVAVAFLLGYISIAIQQRLTTKLHSIEASVLIAQHRAPKWRRWIASISIELQLLFSILVSALMFVVGQVCANNAAASLFNVCCC